MLVSEHDSVIFFSPGLYKGSNKWLAGAHQVGGQNDQGAGFRGREQGANACTRSTMRGALTQNPVGVMTIKVGIVSAANKDLSGINRARLTDIG